MSQRLQSSSNGIILLLIDSMSQTLCFGCLEYSIHAYSCKTIFDSYAHQIDKLDDKAIGYSVDVDQKAQIATGTTDTHQDNDSLAANSPADREDQAAVEELIQQKRGRPSKNQGKLRKDFNLYFVRKLGIKSEESMNKNTFLKLVRQCEKRKVLSKLSEMASGRWKPRFKEKGKQLQAKMRAYRRRCTELFRKFQSEEWTPS